MVDLALFETEVLEKRRREKSKGAVEVDGKQRRGVGTALVSRCRGEAEFESPELEKEGEGEIQEEMEVWWSTEFNTES